MNEPVQISKDEHLETAVPTIWRYTLAAIVEAFANGDFTLTRGVAGVRKVTPEDASRFASYVVSYGAKLTSLPDDAWKTSVCRWMRGYWDVLLDLYTNEEGASDLVLFVRVHEGADGYAFSIDSLHVP